MKILQEIREQIKFEERKKTLEDLKEKADILTEIMYTYGLIDVWLTLSTLKYTEKEIEETGVIQYLKSLGFEVKFNASASRIEILVPKE